METQQKFSEQALNKPTIQEANGMFRRIYLVLLDGKIVVNKHGEWFNTKEEAEQDKKNI